MKWRVFSVVSATLVFSSLSTVQAGPRDDVLEAMGRCAAIADNTARLACYDALAPQLKTALSTPPPSLDRPPTQQEQESWFGFDIGDLFGTSQRTQTTPQQFGADRLPQTQAAVESAQQQVDSISAGVTDYSFTPFGKFIVFLDNGQVWRQIEGDAEHAQFARNPKDNRVTISRGFIGSYNLTINDSAKVFKVSRVK